MNDLVPIKTALRLIRLPLDRQLFVFSIFFFFSVSGPVLSVGGSPTVPSAAHEPPEIIPTQDWEDPPGEVRPVARWWWPGGSVEAEGLKDHLKLIANAGFGAVEVQPLLLGLGEEEFAADPKLRSVGTPEFYVRLAQAAAAAKENELAFDLTLGSGWPGGLPTSPKNAERQLLMAALVVTGSERFEGPLPPAPDQSYRSAVEWVLDVLGPPDPEVELLSVLGVRLGGEKAGAETLVEVRELTDQVINGQLHWQVPPGDWRVLVFYINSTEHFVMGGAFPGKEADARVVDHLSRRGADALINGYASPAVDAISPGQIRGVFVDSFELMGELPFSDEFPEAFKSIAGYDVTPHLPLLFRRGGESKYAEMIDFLDRSGGPVYVLPEPQRAERIREDYEEVRRTLFEEVFVKRFAQWAADRGLEFRLQAHGGYGDYLDTYALSDVPESEGLFGAGSFDFLKLASSAAHVAGRRWASSESFITLRFFGRRLSHEEMKLLAGRAYSAGINRLVFHGVSYPYVRADQEQWYPFSGGFGRILAGPLPMSSEIDTEFLESLPDFNRYLGRLSVAMSQGEPNAEVAWLRSEPIYPDSASLQWGRVEPKGGESTTTRALRARGLSHDRISRRMLSGAHISNKEFRVGARSYRVLVLDPIDVAEPELVERVAQLAESGVLVLALGVLPSRAPGLHEAPLRDARVRAATERLKKKVILVPDEKSLEQQLKKHVTGDFVEPLSEERLIVSIEKRRADAGDIALLFNESWSPLETRLRFTRSGKRLALWDPLSGKRTDLKENVNVGDVITVQLKPAETLILTLAQ